MMELIQQLGAWSWVILGLILLAIELVAPSTILLWPGLSAILVGIVTLIFGVDSSFWPWQLQVTIFAGLSLVLAYFGRDYMKNRQSYVGEQENLNERNQQLIGQAGEISTEVSKGFGRAKIGDSTWRVSGSDMKKGTKVTVVSLDGSTLIVEKA